MVLLWGKLIRGIKSINTITFAIQGTKNCIRSTVTTVLSAQ